MLDQDIISRFTAIVGKHHALTDEADIAPHLTEPRGKFIGNSRLVLKPGSTDEVLPS
jgi:FAD/FMN-containing dehydrogenase